MRETFPEVRSGHPPAALDPAIERVIKALARLNQRRDYAAEQPTSNDATQVPDAKLKA